MPSPPQKILIVDDDPTQLLIVSRWLESMDYEVQTHDSPVGTTHLVKTYGPHLLMLDIDMPIMSGPALLETLKKNVKPPWPAVIFFSGKDMAKMKDLPSAPPVVGFLQKTSSDAYFIAQFRILAAKARQAEGKGAPAARGAAVSADPLRVHRIPAADTASIPIWISTPQEELKLVVEDLSVPGGYSSGEMRLRVQGQAAWQLLSTPGAQFPALVQLPTERRRTAIQIEVVWAGVKPAEDGMHLVSVTYHPVIKADEVQFQRYWTSRLAEQASAASPV